MKGITEAVNADGAPKEIVSFQNRLARSYGAGRIEREIFDEIDSLLQEVVRIVKGTLEEEPR